MSLEDWLPDPNDKMTCVFGTDIPPEIKRAWQEGRESLDQFYQSLSLWERIKLAFKGYILRGGLF